MALAVVGNSSGSGDGDSESLVSCQTNVYDTGPYKAVAAVRVVTGLTSFIGCLLIVLFVLYGKKYRVVMTQKLILFLAISATLHSFSYLVGRINFYSERPIIDHYCLFAGFLELYTGWTEQLCILCISCNLLSEVTCHPNMKNAQWLYVFVIFTLPLFWCWIPFVDLAYGTSGPWCGIRILTEDCNLFVFGLILRTLLKKLPVATLFVATIFFSVTTWILLKRKIRQWETAYPQRRAIDRTECLSELKLLLWYPPVYNLLQVFLLGNTLYDTILPNSPILTLWFLQVLTSPLAGLAIALMCALNSEINLVSRAKVWCTRHLQPHRSSDAKKPQLDMRVSEYHADYVFYGDSIEGTRNHRQQQHLQNHPAVMNMHNIL